MKPVFTSIIQMVGNLYVLVLASALQMCMVSAEWHMVLMEFWSAVVYVMDIRLVADHAGENYSLSITIYFWECSGCGSRSSLEKTMVFINFSGNIA